MINKIVTYFHILSSFHLSFLSLLFILRYKKEKGKTKRSMIYNLRPFFCSDNYTPTAQIIAAFVFGAIFGPWSWGIIFLLIYFIIYEILFYLFTHGDPNYWQIETRLAVFCAYFLGWIVIRTIVNDPVVTSDADDVTENSFLDILTLKVNSHLG